MKNITLLFLLLVPAFLFAQYPNTGNKARLGYQTTGDGLIWRGVAADTVLKPRVIAHAYFQLDTVNAVLRRYIATRGSWQVVGGGSSTDSAVYATRYWTSSNFFPLQGGTLTGTGGAGFIGFPSQVSAPGTPASGLNVYAQGSSFNWKGTDGHERQFASTLTGGRTYTLPDVSGTFALGTGTADRLARWTATNTLAAGNLSDNGTKLQALLPWQFQTYTTAGLPTGVTGYHVYNTTTNGPAWHQGSRWAYGLESTFNRGTATRVPFFDANGQVKDDANFLFDGRIRAPYGYSSIGYGFVGDNNRYIQGRPDGLLFSAGTTGTRTIRFVAANIIPDVSGTDLGNFNTIWGTIFASKTQLNITLGSSSAPNYRFDDGTGNAVNAGMYATGTQLNNNLGFSTRSTAEGAASTKLWINADGKIGISTTSPTQELDVNGDAYIRDSTRLTTTPAHASITGLLTRNTDGWVGLASLAGGLSYSGGVLTGANAFTDTLKRWSNVLFVSPNGDNATAVKNKLTKPWLTLQAAADAAVSGDLVVVLTGTYSAPTNLWKNGVDWHFEDVLISGIITTEYAFSNCPWKATSSGTVNITGNLKTDQLIQIDTAGVNFTAAGFRLGQIFVGGGAIGARVNVRTVETPSAIYVSANNADPITDNIINFYADEWVDSGFGHYPVMFVNNTGSTPKKNSYTIEIGSVAFTSWPDNPRRGMLQGRTVNHRFDSCTTVFKIGKGRFNTSLEWAMLGYFPYQAGTGNSLIVECDDCEFRGSATMGTRLNIQGQDLMKIVGKYTTYSKTFPLLSFEAGHSSTGQRLIFDGEFFGVDTSLFNFNVSGNFELRGFYRNYESDDKIIDQTVANGSYKPIMRDAYFRSPATTPIQSSTATTWYTAGAWDYNAITQDADISYVRENEYGNVAKRDTTIYVVDTDYDFTTATEADATTVTTTEIGRRYNRVIFLMTTTAAAGSNSELILHTPDVNLMQVEYLIRSTDEVGGFTNVIQFGTNNAVQSDNALAGSYTPSAGQGVGIRAGLRSGVYKYYYY